MTEAASDDPFEAFLAKVERDRGFACANYKRTCLRRRIGVRMRARGVESFDTYAALLDRDAREYDRLVDSLTINVTRFFRNAPIWDRIRDEVVPELWESQEPEIRIWSAGTATGEEAYSLAMLLHRHVAVRGMLSQIGRVRITGSDVDRGAIAAADAGAYTEADLEEIPAEFRSRYFSDRPPYTPAAGIRQTVHFQVHDLLGSEYPAAPQHLIICRNVLIYFDRPTQERVIDQFYRSLVPGGYLILGKVESLLGRSRGRFVPVAQRERIFRKAS